jgi:hypothetical protein
MELEAARDRVHEALAGLTDEQMSAPSLDGWSVCDHLNHMTAMHEFRFFEISRVARGGQAAFPVQSDAEIEVLNKTITGWRKQVPVAQAVSDWEFVLALLIDTVANCPEEALDESRYLETGIRGGAEHDISHAEAILAWRKRESI